MDESTRHRILTTARRRFFQLGYKRTTVDELSEELGISKRTLYEYFPSKKVLLHQAMLDLVQGVAGEMQEISQNSSLDSLQKFARTLALIARRLPHLSPVFLRDIQRSAPEVWEDVDRRRTENLRRHFSGLFRQGIEQGFFRSDFDQQLLLLMFSVLVQRILNPETLSQLPLTASQAFTQLTSLVAQGILTEEGRRHLSPNSPNLQEID